MDEMISRIFQDIADRVSGPMNFRVYFQPFMAIFFAIRDGRRDASLGRPAYFWGLFTDPEHRRARVKSGWRSVGKVICLALILDAIYQFIELHRFYPGEALIVAILLAVIPYVALRGIAGRVFTGLFKAHNHESEPKPVKH